MEKYYDINREGCSVRCKLFCDDPRAVKRAVISCHGFGGTKDNKASVRFAAFVMSKYKGTAVICFDWPCHGDDGRKKLCLDDCVTYLGLVIEDIRERFGTDEIYAYATSFGGLNVLHYLSERGNPFRKIVLRCPAICLYESLCNTIMHPDELEKIRKGKDALVGFDRKIKISPDFLRELEDRDVRKKNFMDYADDILIIHGTKDEIIPFEVSEKFAEDNVIEFIPVEKADHRFIDPKLMDRAINDAARFMFT